MHHAYIILFLLFVSEFCDGQQSLPQCKGLGQYCTSHDDCCSNSCLSYSYKCVEYHGNRRNDKPSSTATSIDELVERMNNDMSTKNMYQTDSTVIPTTWSSMETIQPMIQPASTTYEIDRNESDCRFNGYSCLHSDQCCSSFCSKITNMCIQPTENSLSTEQKTPPEISTMEVAKPCIQIGHKCYFNDECCKPYRCHGYLHQCVT